MERTNQPPSPDATEIPPELPGLALRSTVVFPFDVVSVPLDRPRSLRMIEAHPGDATLVACFFPKDREAERLHEAAEFERIGVACRIIHRMRMPNETVQVVLQGLRRVRLVDVVGVQPYYRFQLEAVEEREPRGTDIDGLIYRCMELVDEFVKAEGGYPAEMVNILRMNIAGAGRFADLIGAHVNFSLPIKTRVCVTESVRERLRIVEEVLQEGIAKHQVHQEVAEKVRADIDKRQREHLLRTQLKTIRRELGIDGDGEADILELRERIEAAGLPDEAAAAALHEVDRLASMPGSSAEYNVARTYIGWILDLPWNLAKRPPIDLKKARRVLDRDHHGLEDVKERILEYLAVRRLKNDPRSPVLCLTGPPGVGKTSLGRSIAEAMGREFVRVSVGGLRDEAEIKGHRRTYVGAMPGRIIQALKRAGARDCVFVVDEIDKMGSDARGDPSSAMLEVLDPEQNEAYGDHYLDVAFDLSRVFFICTSNVLENIPGPLRDRMEVVQLSGYTRLEKLHIARNHLLPRVLDEHGLSSKHLIFTDTGLHALIDGYTREAGVRGLQRQIGRICRRRALEVAEGDADEKRARIDDKAVERILGARIHEGTARFRDAAVGVTAGLAWTPFGGDLLFFEASLVPGRGRIKVTGRLGEVMRESAETAFSYVQSITKELEIDPRVVAEHDIHLHVPEGATPKDGPSAGVTMAVCLASLLTGKPVRADLAMTGEITLKGRVLAVGGIKEKVLAAHRAGIRQVVLPEANRKDLSDIPEEVRAELQVHFTRTARENIEAGLVPIYLPTERDPPPHLPPRGPERRDRPAP
ncbi:MAG: endopeptidase La [Planctomycetota bacterium]|nr:endopeptidase La [Planctomycetota bacterium]